MSIVGASNLVRGLFVPLSLFALLVCARPAGAQVGKMPRSAHWDENSHPAPKRLPAPPSEPRPISSRRRFAQAEAAINQSAKRAGCDDCLGHGCPSCSPRWANGEMLLWWRRGMHVPPLVTNNDPVPTVLFGGARLGSGARPGFRFDIGQWLKKDEPCGIGFTFFALAEQNENFDSRGTGQAVVVRVRPGAPGVPLIVNLPGQVDGNVVAHTTSTVLGADVYFRKPKIWHDGPTCVDLLIGYHTSLIDEDLTIRHRFTDNAGVEFDGTDRFATRNEFHGAALGVLIQYRKPHWAVDILARLALGNMRGELGISGSDPFGNGTDASLLVRASNAGTRTRNEFAAVRELGINSVYHLNKGIDLTAGYSLIYWKHVLQPGNQIDLSSPNPLPLMIGNGYFVHGLNCGVRCTY